ncbi:MAG: anthranilate phosphoribosyltransferase [Candidatus Omnitrophica bacterium CG07_land_8_20_14_0_80_50_8]|nr:MAG: anthranilate phosphoribosyltransferase [Candidatus Omnitrophica bacterium CG07_land_8_20_14_0_80_50_8]
MKTVLSKLKDKKDLTSTEMAEAMERVVSGHAAGEAVEQFLICLRQKGETAVEILSAARVMRKHALKLSKDYPGLLDTCGTGGDGSRTLNISTLSALTASAAGAKVAKHGNRSVSSVSGSADLLEGLGVPINLAAPAIEHAIEKVHFAFLFAPNFHPAMRFAMPARKKIQGKTIFNVLGPLSNPANVQYQVIGVYDKKLVTIVAEALLELGTRHALVVHGADGLDEISIFDKTSVAELTGKRIKTYEIVPADYGIKKTALDALRCGTKEEGKRMALRVLKGGAGAACDMVALNSAAALYVSGLAHSIAEGVGIAGALLTQGAVYEKLQEIIAFSKT